VGGRGGGDGMRRLLDEGWGPSIPGGRFFFKPWGYIFSLRFLMAAALRKGILRFL
jgi:hypothetical protein